MEVACDACDERGVAHQFTCGLAKWLQAGRSLSLHNERDEHVNRISVADLAQVDSSKPASVGRIHGRQRRIAKLSGCQVGAQYGRDVAQARREDTTSGNVDDLVPAPFREQADLPTARHDELRSRAVSDARFRRSDRFGVHARERRASPDRVDHSATFDGQLVAVWEVDERTAPATL